MPESSFSAGAIIGQKGGIRHRKVIGIDNDVDSSKVRPTDWHQDHHDPAVFVYAENNTFTSLAASGVVVTAPQTNFKAGCYRITAHLRTSTMTAAASPGSCFLRAGGSQLTNGTHIDLRPTANTQFVLFGVYNHGGGLITFDCFFSRESGTTGFGVNGSSEARFGQKILVERIGDRSDGL